MPQLNVVTVYVLLSALFCSLVVVAPEPKAVADVYYARVPPLPF
jgi:hypothetical protein